MSGKQGETRISRREFIKGAALVGATAAGSTLLAGCGAQPSTGVQWGRETDIVIVGAGGAGIVAAIEARDAGASVTVFDKAPAVGGTTSLSGAVIQAAGTQFQQAEGITGDTPEKHYQYWLQASEGIATPELVRLMADSAPGAIEWLVSQGVTYVSVYGVDPIPYISPDLMIPRIHVPGGRGETAAPGTGAVHIEILYGVAQEKGAEFLMESPVTALIHDPESGAVLGVKAQISGTDTYVKAKRAVILTSGGIDHNQEMARAFSPQQLWALTTGACLCAPTNTGDGVKMGMDLGADLAGLGGTIGVPFTSVGIAALNQALSPVPGIWVNKYGQRFVNEADHYAYVMRAAFDQEEHIAWAIFDENVRALGGTVIGGLWGAWSEDLSEEIASGKVKTGDTPAALARVIDVNPGGLEATLAMWNEDAAAGTDSLFHKDVGVQPFDLGPYYATQVTEANLGTCGGLKINENAHVIHVNGNPIPRLYAAGMVAGGFIGPYYPGSGTAICSTVVFGRIAAQQAAAETPQA
jgi:urocanate reductase